MGEDGRGKGLALDIREQIRVNTGDDRYSLLQVKLRKGIADWKDMRNRHVLETIHICTNIVNEGNDRDGSTNLAALSQHDGVPLIEPCLRVDHR